MKDMTRQQEIERLRAAISWLAPPFVDEQTSHEDLKSRIDLMFEDVRRIDDDLRRRAE